MARTTTASIDMNGMTDGQINSAVAKLRAAMRRHRSTISSKEARQVLAIKNLGIQMFLVFLEHAKRMEKLIVRRAKVDRTRAFQAMVDGTDWRPYIWESALAAMPRGIGKKVEVFFFMPDQRKYGIRDLDLCNEYASRGLVPADPYSQFAVNEADPAFAREYPNVTHWQDKDGKWYYAAFDSWHNGEPRVRINRYDILDQFSTLWFAGRRK